MSMLLQHAFQHATPRWHRKRIVCASSSSVGTTGLCGNGMSGPDMAISLSSRATSLSSRAKRGICCSIKPAADSSSHALLGMTTSHALLGMTGSMRRRRLEQLRLVDEVDVLALEARPLPAVPVVHGIDEAMPVFLVDEVLVRAVIEARIERL